MMEPLLSLQGPGITELGSNFGMGQMLVRASMLFTSSMMIGESHVSGPLFSHL